jgi:1-acyl-sn-glycerol-3-phosphate acyltransferase
MERQSCKVEGIVLMAYKIGSPLINTNLIFKFFSFFTFFIVVILVKIIVFPIYGIKVKGKNRLKNIKSTLFVSNHTLLLDPAIIAGSIFPVRTFFTFLESTALVPILGTFVRLLGGVPVPTGNQSIIVMNKYFHRIIDDFKYLHFFPEGECYLWNQEIKEFQPGVFFFSWKYNLPIIPVIIVLYERKSPPFFKKRMVSYPKVKVIIDKPIFPDKLFQKSDYKFKTLKETLSAYRQYVNRRMQKIIDRHEGDKNIFKGHLKRLF